MILRHELQQLAAALKATKEFANMAVKRKMLMQNPSAGRLMASFEREHLRLINLGLPEGESAARLKKLYTEYSGFLEKQEVRDYIKAVQEYQKMIADNISFLNGLLDVNAAR